ncbi:MAG: amino acid adenylation domain-containing protein [Acidobacteriota bacterium]
MAYVIYTSGSTGRPKGVLIEQRSVANLVSALGHSLRDDLSGKAPLRVGVNAPLAFDASVKQLIQLLEGHTLILVAESVRAVGEAMLDLLERQRVDVLDCTPSQLRLMLAAGLSGSEGRYFPRRVLVGGEAIDGETWDLLAGDARAFFNVYGPTECTVDASLCQVRPGTEPRIGRALPNVSLYVLDASGQQAPLGVAGELRIGGAGVCRGYLERPALTADKVGPDPFGALPGARLYRTGDLVRHRTAGDLEFLGRLDGQVKLRGARLELGEIEAVLCEQTSVAEAAVVVREDRAGDQRLVAYVVPDRRHVERLEESLSRHLRQALRQRLPAVMVPASVVALEKLPLNPSGKVDRRALPAPKAWARDADPAGRVAGTPVEEMLAGVWSELLQLGQVGMEESFFELGGHSLLATQVMSRVRSLFGVEIPLRALFEKPTVAGLAAEVEEAMRTERGLAEPLTPVARGGEMPLSFAQQRLWFIDQLQPGSSVYNIPLAQRFERRLDPAVLAAAFGELVCRHESLRTSFPSIAGEPRQQIAPPAPVSLPVVDLEGLSAADRAKEAHRLTMAEASRPFDLAQGPVLRHGLLRLEKADWVLLVTMHHIASDGWSMGILRRELSALYEAFAAGRPSPLEALPIQYADYAVWQRNWLSGELLSAEIEHWRGQLSGAPPVLELPTDRPRPAVVRYRAASRSQQLPEGLAQSLTALSRRQGTTLFMTFLAAYQVLLSRWSGQADISVGTPIAGRNRLEIEGLIGFFVNTLVLRTHLDDDADSISLLAQVRDTTLEAHAHQDLPFEKLVEELQPERSLSHSPLFQTMLVFQNMTGRRTGAGRELGSADALSWNAKFEMTLALAELDDTVAGVWEYDRDLYDASTVARLAGQFEVLLAEMVAHPQQRLSQLALLQPAERHQLVAEWSHTSAAKATAVSVPELVAARASRAPDALAVVYSDQALSYGELNVRANRLAGYLVDLGVGPGARVGLCLDRSLELVVAVLAVFKAGGAYVPLDPEYPADRLAFMAADSDLSVLVTRKTLRRDFVGQQVRVVELDTLAPEIAACSSTGPRASARLNDLAYVLYTSGSTGKPKGVMVSHRGLANLAEMQVELFGLGSDARVLQFASLSFDASIWEIVMAWRAGACLVEAPKEALLPGESLDSLLRQQAITVVTLPPTALAALSADLPVLEVLVVAGEACPEDLARQWATGRRFFNAYGPTEATVCSTAVRFAGDGALTIGRPLEGSRTYLLDRRLEALPIGVGGELCIGGVGLAQGYLGRPGLTAERFVPDPLGGSPGGRLYRTGDRVRAQCDGALEFLGRLDHQVKVRGFRIELGEIEAALAGQATVHEAVVVARDDAPGGRGLVAYVVPKEQDSPSSAELRMALQASLPEHMVPSAFVAIESLPLLPNGKIDRKALPAPTLGSEVTSRVPRDRVELELVQIWEALLGIPQVDVQASFFELGGHSLLAVRLIEQIRERFGATLPVAVLFERPTIEGLAALLHREGAAPSSTPLVTLQGEGAERPFFCVHPVGGNVFCYLPLAKHLGSRQPFFGLQSLDREEGHGTESIEAMAGEYIAAMRGAQAHGPYRIGGWSMGGFVAFEMARQLLEMGEEIEVLALFDSVAPSVSGKVRRKTDEVLIAEFVRDLGALSGQAVDITPEELRSIPAEDLWGHVTERARAAQALAPEIEPSTLRRYFEVFARNRRAMVAYRPGIFPGSLTLFAVEKARRDPDLGWDALAAGGVEVVTVAGDHYSMLREPRVRNVGQQLGRRLSRAVDTSPTDRPAVTESSSVPIAQRDPVSDIEPVAHLPKSSKSEELNS